MLIVKVLKRKDAASVVVAVVVALILHQLVQMVTPELASRLSGADGFSGFDTGGPGWQTQYLHPVVWAALQLLLLEVLCWVYVFVHGMFSKK